MTVTDEEKAKRSFLWTVGIMLVLISALRGQGVGADTYGYWINYENKRSVDFFDVINNWGDDSLYYYLNGLLSKNGISIQVWFGMIASAYTAVLFSIYYKYSKNVLLSVIMYVSVGTFAFSLAGLKQTCAMAVALLAFYPLKDRKPIRFCLTILLASLFHVTVVIFAFAYLISLIKNKKLLITVGFIMTAIIFTTGISLINLGLGWLDIDRYESYSRTDSNYSLTSFFIQALVVIVSLIFMGEEKTEDENLFLALALSGMLFQAFASTSASTFRLSLYFVPFGAVLYPNSIKKMADPKDIRMIELLSGFVFLAYFLYSVSQGGSISNYEFYWK